MTAISVYRIHGNKLNPRKSLGDMDGLAESIRENGLLNPITITPCGCDEVDGAHYRVLDGHRRLKAMFLLPKLSLEDGEYRVFENITPRQEAALVMDVNIARKQYSPVEEYEALQLKRRYGSFPAVAKKTDASYGNLRNFVSTMDRLMPEVREKVAWKVAADGHKPTGNAGEISIGEARELAQLSPSQQKALVGAGLGHTQLKQAIAAMKEGRLVQPEEVVRNVVTNAMRASLESKPAAAFVAAYMIMLNGGARPEDLVRFGFGDATASRTLKVLRKCGLMRGTGVEAAVLTRLLGRMDEAALERLFMELRSQWKQGKRTNEQHQR